MLLDEPFSALDASLRGELRRDVARILPRDRAPRRSSSPTTRTRRWRSPTRSRCWPTVACAPPPRRARSTATRRTWAPPPRSARPTCSLPQTSAGLAHCALGSIPIRRNGSTPSDGPSRLLIRPEQLVLHREAVERTRRRDRRRAPVPRPRCACPRPACGRTATMRWWRECPASSTFRLATRCGSRSWARPGCGRASDGRDRSTYPGDGF